MKDVISILQSRIAKRENFITQLLMPRGVPYQQEDGSVGTKWISAFTPAHQTIVQLAKEQKQDKRILAEIVKLRREAKQQRRAKALRDVLHKGIKRCQEMTEQEVLEMENKVLAARWGE